MNNLINKNVEFIKNNKVIYICGCNLVICDLATKTSQFILRNSPDYSITSMSVGFRCVNEGFVCIGEYNKTNSKSQISVISLENHNTQYVLTNKDQRSIEWKVFNAKIMKNNSYCIALSKKENPNYNSNPGSMYNFGSSNNKSNSFVLNPMNAGNNIADNIVSKSINFNTIKNNSLKNLAVNNVNKSINFANFNGGNINTNSNNNMTVNNININNNQSQTKFSFWKYSQELFISETILDEELYDCAYNPKNSHEIILCGKGYMRLWNVFINQGSLKEHPQRYLKNKQEKEHTFIKAEFFENKSFMFAVGTLENIIFIIEGFNVICEINAGYKKENIIDLNVNGIKNLTEEEIPQEDDFKIKKTNHSLPNSNTNIIVNNNTIAKLNNNNNQYNSNSNDNINASELNNKINQNISGSISLSNGKKNSSILDENINIYNNRNNVNDNSILLNLNEKNHNSQDANIDFNSGKNIKTENNNNMNHMNTNGNTNSRIMNTMDNNNDNLKSQNIFSNINNTNIYCNKTFFRENVLQTFNLIGNNLILFTFQNESITYLYRLDKELKRKKDLLASNSSLNSLAGSVNIRSEEMEKESREKEEILVNRISKNIKSILNVTTNEDFSKLIYTCEISCGRESQICLYLFNRKNLKISFEKEIFNNFFHQYNTTGFSLCEKNQMFYSINDNKSLRCIDYKNNFFLMQNKLKEQPLNITTCPNNNLIGISFAEKFSLYFQLREKLLLFSEFDVSHSQAKFSEKGDYIAIYGENNFSKTYNIYFVDTFYLNTVHIIENFKSGVKKICWFDNDRYIFALFENNNVFGWNVNFDLLTVNLYNRFKDKEIDIESTYFRMIFKHFVKGNEYENFEYDYKNDLMILTHKNHDKVKLKYFLYFSF